MRSASAALLLVLSWCTATGAAGGTGIVTEGTDHARIQLPATVLAEDHTGFGYSLRVLAGVAEVTVDLRPLESGDPFAPPRPERSEGDVARLARSVTAGAAGRYEASSRILGWVARHIRYELDREQPQDAAAVLARRSGYCTGISRLSVALLEAVGIPAREVAGYVAQGSRGGPAGYHRWIEIHYSDRGWVDSDPLLAHHYVPATYVRLASEVLMPDGGWERGVLLERRDQRAAVDLHPLAPPGVTGRRNHPGQLAGALEVRVHGGVAGTAVLAGEGQRRTRVLVDGLGTFVGLEPGEYRLTVRVEEHPPMVRRIVFRDRVRGTVELTPGAPDDRPVQATGAPSNAPSDTPVAWAHSTGGRVVGAARP